MLTFLRSLLKLAIGVLIYVGLPLVGWGIADVSGFMRNPARVSYVVLTVVLQAIIVFTMPEVGRNRGPGAKSVPRQRVSVLLLQLLSLAIVLVAPYCDRRAIAVFPEWAWVRYGGLVLYALGVIIMHVAEAQLGQQFSVQVTIQADHKLVTQGLYRYVRHPRYGGIILFVAGISLVFRSWLALLLAAALALVLLWRIHDEEALLHEEFGAAWEAYVQASWRLIPFVF